jgi:hypothetical protein
MSAHFGGRNQQKHDINTVGSSGKRRHAKGKKSQKVVGLLDNQPEPCHARHRQLQPCHVRHRQLRGENRQATCQSRLVNMSSMQHCLCPWWWTAPTQIITNRWIIGCYFSLGVSMYQLTEIFLSLSHLRKVQLSQVTQSTIVLFQQKSATKTFFYKWIRLKKISIDWDIAKP